jgi:hypothetical protein
MSLIVGRSVLKGFAFVIGALALGMASPKRADADLVRVNLNLGTSIALGCANGGSHQDVAKTPILKNTTAAAIGKGRTLYWKSSDSDYGSVKLEADLAPGATVQGLGHPGNSYTCTSSFVTSADLIVKKAQFATLTSATIEVQNIDSWVDAPPSITRVEVVSCSGPVLATIDVPAMPLAKGQLKSVTVPFSVPGGKKYLRVRADATKAVIERNEANNLMDDMNSCIY